MNITLVAGARPNFMKIAPIIKAIEKAQSNGEIIQYRLVHTGQHYDKKMSGDFFEELGIPNPDANLECGSGSQAEQTASIMIRFEQELLNNRPDLVLVVGDVTSTMACTITAKKLCIDVAHVEAGIRSGDMAMPEEINRIVTDAICDHFFTTTELAGDQLRKTGVDESRIHFVGNTMIDTLLANIKRLRRPEFWNEFNLEPKKYFLLTLHRPSNVDDPDKLKDILHAIQESTLDIPIVFPVHPRTKATLDKLSINKKNLFITGPQNYLEFIFLVKNSMGVITDSGGITEEATVLQVPCLTLRNSTERPETISLGTNELIGDDLGKLKKYLKKVIDQEWKKGSTPPLWDGHTSERIIGAILEIYSNRSVNNSMKNAFA